MRGREIFRFHAEFHFDFILGNDFNQWTARRNNLTVLGVDFGNHTRHVGVNAVIPSGAGALQTAELSLGIARRFFRCAQILICRELQIETLLRLLEFFPRSLRRILGLLELHLRTRT